MTRIASTVCVALLIAIQAAYGDVPGPLPNLSPGPPYGIELAYVDPFVEQGPRALRFTAAVGNIGPAPFELVGVLTPDGEAIEGKQCHSQVIVCVAYADVGSFPLEPFLSEWFTESFVRYELRRLTAGDEPDLTDQGLLATGGRTFVCPLDTGRVSLGNQVDDLGKFSRFPLCHWSRAGISPGFYYAEGSGEYEQYVSLDGVVDGRYALVVRVNPDGVFIESDHTDNDSFRLIELREGVTDVVVYR